MASITYRPEIDGLRAVAVIPVILFHSGAGWIEGGYLGVDVFFVICGFLITTIILQGVRRGAFHLQAILGETSATDLPPLTRDADFDIGRLRSPLVQGGLTRARSSRHSAALWCANIAFWQTSGNYWGADANESPFLHTWSLSVEEQFYLLHPFLLVLIIKFVRRRMLGVLSLFTVCSFLLYLYGSHSNPVATFYLLYASLGARLWLHPGRLGPRQAGTLTWPRLRDARIRGTGRRDLILLPLLGRAFLRRLPGGPGHGTCPADCVQRGFRVRREAPLAAGGRLRRQDLVLPLSLALAGHRSGEQVAAPPGVGTAHALLLLTTFVISVLSYNYIEIPTRHAPFRSTPLRLCVASFFASLAISFNMYTQDNSYDCSMYGPVVWEGNSYSVCPVDAWAARDATLREGIVCRHGTSGNAVRFATGGIIKRHGGGTPEIVVLGDSHVLMWAGTIDRVAAELGVMGRILCRLRHLAIRRYPPEGDL